MKIARTNVWLDYVLPQKMLINKKTSFVTYNRYPSVSVDRLVQHGCVEGSGKIGQGEGSSEKNFTSLVAIEASSNADESTAGSRLDGRGESFCQAHGRAFDILRRLLDASNGEEPNIVEYKYRR